MKCRWMYTLIIICFYAVNFTSTYGQETINLETRTKQEIIDKAQELPHTGAGEIWRGGEKYIVQPQIQAPYASGILSDAFLEDGLNTINMIRYIAGYPADIELEYRLNDLSQHGATLLAKLDTLTHYPEQPADMPDDFFKKAALATSNSNLAAAWGYEGNYGITQGILSCMDDGDESNIRKVGHRRWLLNPQMQEIGFGYAENDVSGEFIDIYVFDKSREEEVSYDVVTWPTQGVFPIQYFEGHQPWSISLNLEEYERPNAEDIEVCLTRKGDGKVWYFNKESHSEQNDFYVSNANTGLSNAIIFRPNKSVSYNSRDVYEVKVTGIKDTEGNSVEIAYEVEFFDIDEDPNSAIKNGWYEEEGEWYYYEQDIKQTGWLELGDKTYWLDEEGARATGWTAISGYKYYFYDTGVMAHDTEIDGIHIGGDGSVSLTKPFIERFYEICFQRDADPDGLSYWDTFLRSGIISGAEFTKDFIHSTEFQNQNLSDEEYIELMYNVFFDRGADPEGLNNWKDNLQHGLSRDYVLAGFINSPEFHRMCEEAAIEPGAMALESVLDKNPNLTYFTYRFYEKCIGRAPEAGGLEYWVGELSKQSRTGRELAEYFVFGPEFANKDLTHEAYLDIMYEVFFGRSADQGGKDYWISRIGQGMTRADVFYNFVDSVEFRGICEEYGIKHSN